jgi:hypothetical protein
MSSPFSFFRRNQHVTMVAIVILSMVAFTISDMMTQDINHFVTLGVLLGGAVMAFVGISRGRWFQYGIAGAITGGILAWIIPGFLGGTGEFYQTSTLGAFDSERIRQLHLRRTIANAFMEQAFGKAFGAGTEQFAPRFGFYPTIEDDAIFGELMLAEAEELGIVVTDAMVSSYINSNTGDKLSEKDFVDIRNNLAIAGQRISETDIIEAFRSEIAAQMAYLQKSPSSSASTQPPAALYDLFLRSQVRQRLNLVRLDVDSFVSRIPIHRIRKSRPRSARTVNASQARQSPAQLATASSTKPVSRICNWIIKPSKPPSRHRPMPKSKPSTTKRRISSTANRPNHPLHPNPQLLREPQKLPMSQRPTHQPQMRRSQMRLLQMPQNRMHLTRRSQIPRHQRLQKLIPLRPPRPIQHRRPPSHSQSPNHNRPATTRNQPPVVALSMSSRQPKIRPNLHQNQPRMLRQMLRKNQPSPHPVRRQRPRHRIPPQLQHQPLQPKTQCHLSSRQWNTGHSMTN